MLIRCWLSFVLAIVSAGISSEICAALADDIKAEYIDDFYDLVVNNNDVFVDKSLLICEVLKSPNVSLITQPRGYGKTLNMDMLRRFFEIEVNEKGERLSRENCLNRKLFAGGTIEVSKNTSKTLQPLKIASHKSIMALQGEFPVIFISFKDIAGNAYQDTEDGVKNKIGTLLSKYGYLKEYKDQHCAKQLFASSDERKNGTMYLQGSLTCLCKLLHKHFNRKVIMLIDEYDTPIINSYMNFEDKPEFKKEFDKVVDLFWVIMVNSLKGNEQLERALVTGILPIRSHNLGPNNVADYTFLNKKFSKFYGFTRTDVEYLLNKTSLNVSMDEINKWHYGYNFHREDIYNPWSIMRHLSRKEEPQQFDHYYWLRENEKWFFNQTLMANETEEDLYHLVAGKNIWFNFTENIDLEVIGKRNMLLNVLAFSGGIIPNNYSADSFVIDNKAAEFTYRTSILQRLCNTLKINISTFYSLVQLLTFTKMTKFKEKIEKIFSAINLRRTKSKELKMVYKRFMISLTGALTEKNYTLINAKYVGDMKIFPMLLPKKAGNAAILLRYKIVYDPLYLKYSAVYELEQINLRRKKYDPQICRKAGVKNLIKVTMAFYINKISVQYQIDDYD